MCRCAETCLHIETSAWWNARGSSPPKWNYCQDDLSGCKHRYCAVSTCTVTQPEETTARLFSDCLQMAALRLDLWNSSEDWWSYFQALTFCCPPRCHVTCKSIKKKPCKIRISIWVSSHFLHPTIAKGYCLHFRGKTLRDGFFFQGKGSFGRELACILFEM